MDSSFHSYSSCGRLDIMSMPDREREGAGATTILGSSCQGCVLAFKPFRLSDQGIRYYLSHFFSPSRQSLVSLRAFRISCSGTWYPGMGKWRPASAKNDSSHRFIYCAPIHTNIHQTRPESTKENQHGRSWSRHGRFSFATSRESKSKHHFCPVPVNGVER